jgi:DNA-directed RNA polymerase specialized sigma24 family protein
MIHAGANAFVVRPLDSRALHGLIRALLRRSGSAEEGGDPLDGLYRIVEAQYREHVDACAARNRLSRRWGFREEIVSDVLLELWRALPGFVAYDASAGFRLAVADDEMRGWLAVTTANRCAARGRRAARHERKLAKTREILAHELRGGDSPPFFQG